MPATTLEIYERLRNGERIRVKLVSKLRYDVLRTELCRYHRITRDLLSLSDDAICSSYLDGVGVFRIGRRVTYKTITMVTETEEIKNG